jgi:hypothetical protein
MLFRILLNLGAKCTEFRCELCPVCQIPRPLAGNYQSVLLHKVCADLESNPEPPIVILAGFAA